MQFKHFSLLTIVFGAAFAVPAPTQLLDEKDRRIVNGTDASILDYPFMISLRGGTGSHSCGGSILSELWILTAAHCVGSTTVFLQTVQVGRTTISREVDESVYGIALVIPHPGYDSRNSHLNDIALLKLERPLEFSERVAPVRLPEELFEVEANPDDLGVTLIGWGLTQTGGSASSVLQQVDYYVVPNAECNAIHTSTIHPSQICAATPGGGKGQCSKELRSCTACGEPISDKFLLDVGGCSWHSACLRCCICHTPLDHQPSCFVRERQIYCKTDYAKTFGAKCARCSRTISATDWVRRARDLIFHLACFACDSCGRQLSTGEQFALVDDKVLCKTHYSEMFDCGTSSDDGCEADGYQKNNKTKRVRTTFTEEQLQILQANFNIDSNPDGQDLERIASVTGLSKRVTQVWFQNSRARQKKHVQVPREGELNPFARHINLQLSYTFQQTNGVHGPLHLGTAGALGGGPPFGGGGFHGSHQHGSNHSNNNNNNNNNNSSSINHNHSSKSSIYSTHDSSLDELSEDSAIHCMQSEA